MKEIVFFLQYRLESDEQLVAEIRVAMLALISTFPTEEIS